jgi:hypothetical protein
MFFIAGFLPSHIAKSRHRSWAQVVAVAGWKLPDAEKVSAQ